MDKWVVIQTSFLIAKYWFYGILMSRSFWGFSLKLAVVGEINKKVSLFSFLSFFLALRPD